jgi:lipopolysaccharide biosynthesis glycosyltransferase
MRLIVTFAIGGMPWVGPSVASMRAYASKVGADFHEVKWFPDESSKPYSGKPVWAFVDFLKRFREQDYYKELLVLDCDVLILPSCPNLFEMGGDLICSPDQAWPTKDDRYKEWVAKYFPDSTENDHGVEGLYFNAGILLFRLEALRTLNLEPPYPDEMGYDQDFLNMRTSEAGISITWVGEEYNQRNVGDRQWTLANNHILHFVGGGKARLMDYANFLGIG